MKHIKRKELTQVVNFIASLELQEKFSSIVKPIWEQIDNISRQQEILLKTKLDLLPRLISGKLSVQQLNIHYPPSML